jgi:hypothetical protein
MTPVVMPAERVCSIKASLVLAGDSLRPCRRGV